MRLRLVVAMAALILVPAAGFAATATVSVRVDGLSDLILSGGTVKWHHISFTPPGATTINSVVWNPTGLSNFCNCDSDLYTGLLPRMSQSTSGYSIVKNAGRGSVTIEETPSSANGWALRIRFDDVSQGGDDLYNVNVTYPEEVPTASTWTLAALCGALALAGVWAIRR